MTTYVTHTEVVKPEKRKKKYVKVKYVSFFLFALRGSSVVAHNNIFFCIINCGNASAAVSCAPPFFLYKTIARDDRRLPPWIFLRPSCRSLFLTNVVFFSHARFLLYLPSIIFHLYIFIFCV